MLTVFTSLYFSEVIFNRKLNLMFNVNTDQLFAFNLIEMKPHSLT